MPAINIVDKFQAIQYTGSNSAEIDGLITSFTIDSESGGSLTFTSQSTQSTVSTGDWIRFSQGAVVSTHSNSFQSFAYLEIATAAEMDDALFSAGVKECPLLIVGNTTVSVDIIPAMPDTNYTPSAQLFASVALLGSLSISSVTVVDANTVDVVVNNGGVVSLTGANVLVTVTK